MNRMEFEKIKHDAAKEVFENTEYDWADMLDNTALADQSVKDKSPEEMKAFWLDFFKDTLAAVRYSDQQ